MHFDSLQAFLDMGGHAPYVWPAYITAVVVIIALFVQPIQRKRRFMKQQQMILRRNQREDLS